ncbi:MAG: glycosyltransferase family A protein [Burkholderiaceae bacterium]|nr:glycosyltransferase family A protein [Burkholderiaceae bacterium]
MVNDDRRRRDESQPGQRRTVAVASGAGVRGLARDGRNTWFDRERTCWRCHACSATVWAAAGASRAPGRRVACPAGRSHTLRRSPSRIPAPSPMTPFVHARAADVDRQERPTVSVVLPVRNGAASIVPAMRSILAQSMGSLEVVVVDDGSTDETVARIVALDDPRVRVQAGGRRQGLAARLNEGLDAARGFLVARMDADDLAFPERFARQVAFLEQHPEVDLVGTRAIIHDETGHATGVFPGAPTHEVICATPWRGFRLCHPTWMGRREWFLRWRYREHGTSRCEDQELLLRSRLSSRFACLPDVLLAYRWDGLRPTKALPSRLSLLARQLETFAGERRWGLAAASVAAACGKVALDLASALGGRRIVHARFASTIDPGLEAAWRMLKRDTGAFEHAGTVHARPPEGAA